MVVVVRMAVVVLAKFRGIRTRMPVVGQRKRKVELMGLRDIGRGFKKALFRHKCESLAHITGSHRFDDHARGFRKESLAVLGKSEPKHRRHAGFKYR